MEQKSYGRVVVLVKRSITDKHMKRNESQMKREFVFKEVIYNLLKNWKEEKCIYFKKAIIQTSLKLEVVLLLFQIQTKYISFHSIHIFPE